MSEVWRRVKGYPDYEVSDLGRLKSFKSDKTNGKIMSPAPTRQGYLRTCLGEGGVTKPLLVHRLVCENFLPNEENKKFVNHKNGIKGDNRLENLEWVTNSENVIHAIKELGILMGVRKKVIQYDRNGKRIREWDSIMEACRTLGISHSSISQCCAKIRRSCGGFVWRFPDA